MLDNSRLRIAIQNQGRLAEDSARITEPLWHQSEFAHQRLIALAENMPIDILRHAMTIFRPCIADGVVDPGHLSARTCWKKSC